MVLSQFMYIPNVTVLRVALTFYLIRNVFLETIFYFFLIWHIRLHDFKHRVTWFHTQSYMVSSVELCFCEMLVTFKDCTRQITCHPLNNVSSLLGWLTLVSITWRQPEKLQSSCQHTLMIGGINGEIVTQQRARPRVSSGSINSGGYRMFHWN